jgi:5-methylthioadenosine/S-adenosylhomocysteine deaminase
MTAPRRTRLDAGLVIAHDGREHRLLRDGSVVYENGVITYVGPQAGAPAGDARTLPGHILSPGFISLHNHLGFGSIDRSFREDCSPARFYGSTLFEYVLPLMRALPPPLIPLTTRLSMAELIRSGVTTCVDVTDRPDIAAEAAQDTGLRAYIGKPFSSCMRAVSTGGGIRYEPASQADDETLLDQAVESLRQTISQAGRLVQPILSPGAADTCTPAILARAAETGRELGLRMTTHCGQSLAEFHEIVRQHGRTPVQLLGDAGFLGEDVILAHCVFIDGHSRTGSPNPARDLDLLGRTHTTVAHCPTQFARTGTLLEDFARYKSAGARIGLSTDAAPQCMLSEMRIGAMLAKIAASSPGNPAALDFFTAATTEGADALGRPDLGRIAVGARADLVLFRTGSPALTPARDPVKSIVYHASPLDISSVIVEGREIARDGKIHAVDVPDLTHQIAEACEQQVWPALARHGSHRSVDDLAPNSLRPWHSNGDDRDKPMGDH